MPRVVCVSPPSELIRTVMMSDFFVALISSENLLVTSSKNFPGSICPETHIGFSYIGFLLLLCVLRFCSAMSSSLAFPQSPRPAFASSSAPFGRRLCCPLAQLFHGPPELSPAPFRKISRFPSLH